ncbi:MAG: EF2563 family selenium-dependent molybdenum hydroxylase system protein [Desulfobacula sp.]|uniref:selenium-dependent molybdenum cofactor biosynthesis protein YqeB n=1 Tax=Desulfobacula sp. TaxID=2593537 RepID=UPI0025BFC359|nr:selenium-dependent molybdenum cofactor biosynthesis protein YqeB [Desulfobacula sp.]MCD4720842.1 EF2563 family selenium-dependent molybdenum hydroxylase system protein [Desulfobacula sp.]
MKNISELIIAVKGAGEMATGLACRLFQSNFKHIFMMEIQNPMAVRRQVSFCEAIHDGEIIVEGLKAKKVLHPNDIRAAWDNNSIPVIVDPGWESIKAIRPHVVIDAIIAKKNLGTNLLEAPLVIGLGPGFEAGKDVHMAIETNRGHNLGRIILKGCPEPNTGAPGNIDGYTIERVVRAPCTGIFTSSLSIGTLVKKNDVVGYVDNKPVITQIDGIVRGQIRNNISVTDKLKIGDIDPRGNIEYCTTVSEKARAIGGSVLEAILRKYNH